LPDLSQVLIMSVNPGFGGQKFIENTYRKIYKLNCIREELGLDFKIEVDGGVNNDNARFLVENGADVLVAGSFVFNSTNPLETIAELRKN